MKTRILTLLLSLMIGGVTSFAQEKPKSQTPAKAEKPCEMTQQKEAGCAGMQAASCCAQGEKKSTGNAKTGTKEATVAYSCPMHPEVQSDKAGKCPKCGMDLKKK